MAACPPIAPLLAGQPPQPPVDANPAEAGLGSDGRPEASPLVLWGALLLSSASTMGSWLFMLHVRIIGDRIGATQFQWVADLTLAASLFGVGRVVGTIAHFFVLGSMSSFLRVAFGLALSCLATAMLLGSYYAGPEPSTRHLAPMACAYLLCGFGRAISEPNLYSYIGRLGGKETKRYLSYGYVLGWQVTSALTFTYYGVVSQSWRTVGAVMGIIVALYVVAIAFHLFVLPKPAACEGGFDTVPDRKHAVEAARAWREWVPPIRLYVAAYSIVGAFSAFIAGMVQLLYVDEDGLEVLPGVRLDKNLFLAVYAAINVVAGFLGSRAATHLSHPIRMSIALEVVAALFASSRLPFLGLISGAGSVGAATIQMAAASPAIDRAVPKKYNVMATSFWVMWAAVGTVFGTAAAGPIKNIVVAASSATW